MKYKKLLITGFDPFGGESVNPSWEAVKELPDQIEHLHLTKMEVPTEFHRAAPCVIEAAEQIQPDFILCVGQAGGRKAVTPEVIAINLREASIPDNAGFQPVNVPVITGAREAYFSTLPVRDMTDAIRKSGLPSSLSYSAGAFVCNDLLYSLLHHFHGSDTKVGFIHVPYLPEQVKSQEPSMALEDIVKALHEAISVLDGCQQIGR